MPSTEAPISINLKSAGGTGITLRAESAEEFADMIANGIHIIVDAVKEVEIATKGLVAPSIPVTTMPTMPPTAAGIAAQFGAQFVDTIGATSVSAQEYTQPTHNPAQVSSLGGRNCPHGKMTAIQGMGKDGKPYKGFFCPAPKGSFDKCKNQYVNMQSPDWNTFVPDSVK